MPTKTAQANEVPGICTTLPSLTCHHPGRIRAVRNSWIPRTASLGWASPHPLGVTPAPQVPLPMGISGIWTLRFEPVPPMREVQGWLIEARTRPIHPYGMPRLREVYVWPLLLVPAFPYPMPT